jgi:hypothetical protein
MNEAGSLLKKSVARRGNSFLLELPYCNFNHFGIKI